MRCPDCGGTMSKVPITRHDDSFETMRRRRLCKRCGKRWWTREIPEELFQQVTAITRYLSRVPVRKTT